MRGAESKFFNGHTNISDDKFICFGVKGLMEANKKLMVDDIVDELAKDETIAELYDFVVQEKV